MCKLHTRRWTLAGGARATRGQKTRLPITADGLTNLVTATERDRTCPRQIRDGRGWWWRVILGLFGLLLFRPARWFSPGDTRCWLNCSRQRILFRSVFRSTETNLYLNIVQVFFAILIRFLSDQFHSHFNNFTVGLLQRDLQTHIICELVGSLDAFQLFFSPSLA